MGVKVKPGMYCEQCGKPVAAQKQTHKARSIIGGALTYGAAVKVGEWHCQQCGFPVFGTKKVQGDYVVVVTALPRPDKKPTSFANNSLLVLARHRYGTSAIRNQSDWAGMFDNLPVSLGGWGKQEAEKAVGEYTGSA